MLKKLAALLAKHPMKSILLTLLAILIFAGGAQNVQMKTGNDTLVSSDSTVYKDNQGLEEEFGGESIIVLYEADDGKKIMTTDRLAHMKNLEDKLSAQDDIYTTISPVTLIEEMSAKQGEKYLDGVNDIVDGLEQMGSSLIEIGEQVNAGPSTGGQQLDQGQVDELSQGIDRMVQGQEKLKGGTTQLVNGYAEFGSKTEEAGTKLAELASSMNQADPQQQKQAAQLKGMSMQLIQLSEKMNQVSEKSASLPGVPDQTIKGLKGIESGLSKQQGELAKMQEQQQNQKKQLSDLGNGLEEMGNKLVSISDNLGKMAKYSDTMHPGLPERQETLEQMIYDDNGVLRESFDEVVIDEKTMMMIVKFEGNADEASKSEVTKLIKDYLDEEELESTKTMVSGKPVLDEAVRTSMKESMQKMMLLSLLFMVIVLFFTMKVSWRLLSLAAILIAVIGTVGLMGWLQIPITMVSMAVFPILIGLGIDYSIQFHSRYSEEMAAEEDMNEDE